MDNPVLTMPKRRCVHRKKESDQDPEFGVRWMPIYEQARIHVRLFLMTVNGFPGYVDTTACTGITM